MNFESTLIRDPSARTNFTMIPNIVIDMPGLSHTALRLYIWFKRVCGDAGQCYQSLETISSGCSMEKSSVIRSRELLVAAGLIEVETSTKPDGSKRIVVTIVDIWTKNAEAANLGAKADGVVAKASEPISKSLVGRLAKAYCNKNHNSNKTLLPSGNGELAALQTEGSLIPAKASDGEFDALDKFAAKATAVLIEGLQKKRGLMRKPSPGQWKLEFKKFLKENWDQRDRIKATLLWYVEHMSDSQYIPKARSAKTFCEKFDAIEDAKKTASAKMNGGQVQLADPDEIICAAYRRKTGNMVFRKLAIPDDELVPLMKELKEQGKI